MTLRGLGLVSAAALSLACLLAGGASAAPFSKMPALGDSQKDLQIRVVRYNGSTNGKMVVEVRNQGQSARTFRPDGLYFVPQGNPESAPQRLGASGSFTMATDQRGELDKLEVAPRRTVRVELDVYCIDSHRSSPTSQTPFKVANKRMPKRLREKITTGSKKVKRAAKARPAAAADSEVQSYIWETRDDAWVPLEGERTHEKQSSAPRTHHPQRRHKRPLPNRNFDD